MFLRSKMPQNWLFTLKIGQTTSLSFWTLKKKILIILFLLVLILGFFLPFNKVNAVEGYDLVIVENSAPWNIWLDWNVAKFLGAKSDWAGAIQWPAMFGGVRPINFVNLNTWEQFRTYQWYICDDTTFNNCGANYTIEFDAEGWVIWPPTGSTITIIYPESESEMTQAFDIEGTYDLVEEDWNRILIILEQWNEQSTCPEYGTPEFEEENGKGWFIYQSFPFFSDYLEEAGDFIAPVEDLRLGNYNCSRCYFINEEQGTISGEKCRGYTLNITGQIVYPTIPPKLPFKSWVDYYAENSEKYITPTGLFTSIANALWGLIQKMGDFIVYVKTFFNPDEAMTKGTQLGGAIPIARGYLNSIDDFFGGLPISTFFIFYILCLAVVIAYKVIIQIIKLLKP